MDQTALPSRALPLHATNTASQWLSALGAWGLGFLPIVVLALEGGGYDPVVRGQFGIAVWWIIGLGCAIGALRPTAPTKRALWVGALLVALAGWTAIGLTTTESSERTLTELARLITYLGIFVLGLFSVGRRHAHAVVIGVASAIAVVAVLALLSRLQPELFPVNETGTYLAGAQQRLNWPLNYWNGLAALCAIGVPLLLAAAASDAGARVRGLCAAAVPALILCIDLTVSRGGVLATAFAVAVLFAVWPARSRLAVSGLIIAAGSVVLVLAAGQRPLTHRDILGGTGLEQGDELTLVLAVVCAGTGLLQAGYALLASVAGAPPELAGAARRFGRPALALALLGCAPAVALWAPSHVSRAWNDFKSPAAEAAISDKTDASRLSSASSNGRYELWSVAIDSLRARPLTGSGAGTFEFAWLQDARAQGIVKDAHSFYLELGAELGLPGLLLGVALVVGLLSAGWSGRGDVRSRMTRAAAAAAISAFALSVAVDWVWELSVVPVAALLLAAAGFASMRREPSMRSTRLQRGLAVAAGVGAVGLLAVVLAGETSVRNSQAAARNGNLPTALDDAAVAQRLNPSALTPVLQAALVHEQSAELNRALVDARRAAAVEPMNWRAWLVLSRLEARSGHSRASVTAFRRARGLNPRYSPFSR